MGKNSPLDLMNELTGVELHVSDFIESAYWFEDSTPSHIFKSVIADAFNNSDFILVVARDMFDRDLSGAVIQFVRNNKHIIDTTKPITILQGFHNAHYGFDTICLINPEVHGLLKEDSTKVHLRTVQAFPAYHSEFNKNDDVDLLRYVRSKFVSTLDWNRLQSPRVWLKFSNKVTHSTGKKFGIALIDKAFQEILRIAEFKVGWAEINNYLDEHIKVTYENNNYLITVKNVEGILHLPENEILHWVSSYLIDGLESVK